MTMQVDDACAYRLPYDPSTFIPEDVLHPPRISCGQPRSAHEYTGQRSGLLPCNGLLHEFEEAKEVARRPVTA